MADHTPIVPLAQKCAEMLNGYIVTPEVNDIDSYIVQQQPPRGKRGHYGLPGPGRTGASVADAPTGRDAPGKSDLRNDAHASYKPLK